MRAPLLTCAVLVVLVHSAPAGAGTPRPPGRLVRFTATPTLIPAYSPAIHDYVTRCSGTAQTRFTTWSATGTVATIAGKPARTATVALRPGAAVTIEARGAGGVSAYHVRCLPADFPDWQVTGPGAPERRYFAAPTLGGARSHYVVCFDQHGVPVWWYRDAGVPIDAKLLPGGLVAYATFNGPDPAYQLRRLDGTLVRRIRSPDGQIDDHELQVRTNGDPVYLVYQPKEHVDLTALGGPADATVLEARIEELSPDGKQLVWSWSTDGHVDPAESAAWQQTIIRGAIGDSTGGSAYDVFHANSVSLLGDLVLLSLRYTNSIYAIDRTTGAILWKLGGTPTPASLTVLNDPLASLPLVGQHDGRLQPDGTITVFDDGTAAGRSPRAVHYRLDASARTATLLDAVADPSITTSPCCGSARLLVGGDWVVSWGGDPVFGEYSPDGTPLLRVTFGGLFSYRVTAVAPDRLSAATLRAGMDAMAER